jgi:imidazoleglycerol phosphate dehydratase HisB
MITQSRQAEVSRTTKETTISVSLDLDGEGEVLSDTQIGFLDHMLTALGHHARFNLSLSCRGDLPVDDHHTVEDCALVLGTAIDKALGDRHGIARFASAYAPLDEALARAVVDLSGRPFAMVELGLQREMLGALACENVSHFFHSLSVTARAAIHVDLLRGENDHHRAEAAFKALALALRMAVAIDGGDRIPSTKGAL